MANKIVVRSGAKDLAQELYLKGFSVEKIAEILNKNIKTIRNYKSQAGDWDKIKAHSFINNHAASESNVYENFVEQMYLAIKEIRQDSKLSAKEKSSAIGQIGDSFVKMKKVAKLEDPSAYKLCIAKKVITLVVDEFRKITSSRECIENLICVFDSPGFIKSIEELE